MPDWIRLLWRLPLLGLHVFIGIPIVLISFLPGIRNLPLASMRLHQWTHQLWSRWMLKIFGVALDQRGQLPVGPCLIVANHISWLDIVVLHALWPMWLVAKAEIRGWPLVGKLADLAGTLFIQRGSEASRRRIGRRMAALLKRGERVGIFPEGGIRPEPGVGRFHARLFAPALRADVPVVPVAIRYDRGGDLHEVMVFGPGENFFGNLFRLLRQAPSTVQLTVGSPLKGQLGNRSQLARQCNEIVKGFYDA
ncbi:lysophospholipid acyltransferase family protein [Wenzhouxiangella marina]|uniref:Acetyltransferase n=1 Tax=Wenzhouxiangella marina TaxID=1579979 RepID=A0A0K0XTQ1_9GAMM|nr:lysophospholipid acyltransferase family protein [Wenzhouxiangella marina]AKS41040.1 acetyltransferase [Wenzhouxiangella marina]MBB6087918.1 1-acyl-sn-glycerol-3-phosphate acyltransferase [Wenzhouxiangella marina]